MLQLEKQHKVDNKEPHKGEQRHLITHVARLMPFGPLTWQLCLRVPTLDITYIQSSKKANAESLDSL